MPIRALSLCILVLVATAGAAAQLPLMIPETTYDPAVPSPETVLGFPLGSRPARYDEAVKVFASLVSHSGRVKMLDMGRTYEGRTQYLLILGSEENIRNVDALRANNTLLADPRASSEAEARQLIEHAPAVVWAGYGIHGDELSSVDAALQVSYQLAAGTDTATRMLLRELLVVIEPMQNPDGRERFLAQMQQWGGGILNPDAQSIHHMGSWPYGRGNHYLFDVNRDWALVTQAETQHRLKEIVRWNPQVVIDSHEMGADDTYLFSPPREPLNPNVPPEMHRWWKLFAADQARAFDRFGWSYYTREWNDEWYPGYGASWPLYNDAVGILYEQAGVEGSIVKRPDGTLLTYGETVHHHVVSTVSNLTTAAQNRKELLKDFYDRKRRGPGVETGQPRSYVFVPGNNPTRVERLVSVLEAQGLEVYALKSDTRMADLHDYWGSRPVGKTVPAGSYVVSLDQPRWRLAKALLEFDPRMKTSVLQEERKSLERDGDSKLYDVTSWSLPIASGVEAYWSASRFPAPAERAAGQAAKTGTLRNPEGSFGFVMEYADDRGVDALCALLEAGLTIRVAREPFAIEGHSYGRGSVLMRRNENGPQLRQIVEGIAGTSGVTISGVGTALSSKGVDLGGNDMLLLRRPRVAIVGGVEISTTGFGGVWYLLDQRYRMRTSILTAAQLGGADLQKYNVLLIPSGDSQAILRTLGKQGISRLRTWVESGGTLIAIGAGAAFAADSSAGLAATRLRQHVLKELDTYARAVLWEKRAMAVSVDSVQMWEGTLQSRDTARAAQADEKELLWQEERGRLFMPRGTFLAVDLDPEHWLNYGMDSRVAALVFGSTVLMSKDPVRTTARFADAAQLRVSGLLWPEARDRWARTAYITREGRGNGQIILFAGDPAFRGAHEGTQRILMNSILLGPGCGTHHLVEW